MSHPGHIRHFNPTKNNGKANVQDDFNEKNLNSTIIPHKQSNYLIFFKRLKTKLLTFSKSTYNRNKRFSIEQRKNTKIELKQKYLTLIREQKAKGNFEWLMIPLTWLEWKLTNKPWIIKRLTGLLILIISIYSLDLLNTFVGYGTKTFFGLIKVAIGVILNMILSFVVLIGLGLTFMKYK